ncbi:MAG: gliding motility-associated C-terminal domain-containing protein [Chitinophagales bacterium]|nr:gliding motility-associated C-terminal domain-containing protein [Chitinophagales bacterium]
MKRIVTLLVFGLVFSTAAFAQPSINIIAPDGDPPCTGDAFCVDVEVADFTDILSTQYYIEWDSTVLQLTGTGAYNLPGLTGANFTQINAGRLLLTWEFDDCMDPNAAGHTILADGTIIYEVCFEVLGDYGASSQIIIPTTGDPDLNTPYIRRKSTTVQASCANIGIETAEIDTALIGSCLRPFIIDISDESGNEGDLVCIDFRVLGFDGLTSFQFPVVWDSTKAVFENVIVPQNLANFSEANIGNPINAAGVQEGSITVSWSAPPPANVLTVTDSTLIFQLCLRLKDGSCAMDFDVSIADEQPGQPFFRPQASNEFGGGFANIPVGQYAGNVQIGACNPTGLELVANCGAPVNLNEQICVQVEAGSNFTDVTQLAFLMEWNPTVLQYTGVQNINLLGLDYPGDFNEANTANGILGLNWDEIAQDRPEGTVLFEVCFDVIGLGGNSPFSFINNDDDIAVINFGPNIGINPTNCAVEVNQPAGVVIDLTDGLEGRPGDTLCFEFPVTNFTDVEHMSFSLAFEPNNMEFILAGGVQDINLPEATIANFGFIGALGGQITFNWTPTSAVTLADGTSLFTLCFRIPDDAQPGTCDELIITNEPLVAEVITSTSNGEDIGLIGTGGGYCIVSPEGFYLEGLSVTGDLQDTICLPYVVSEFDGITDASFCLNWNPATMELVEIVDNGLIPSLNIDIMGSPVGAACFDFNEAAGLTLPDSANIFDLCFELLGPADTCYTVEVSSSPTPTVNTLNGAGSLLSIDGEVCINDKLFITVIDSLIIPESCPGAEDGSIQVLISGGVGPYIYSWGTSPTQNTPEARFLSGGEITLIVLDQSGLVATDTFFIPTLGGDLIANIGVDRLSSCDPDLPCTLVNPVEASSGPDIVYEWTGIQGGQVCSTPNDLILLGRGPGLFVLEVLDTAVGCSVTDTVQLLEPYYPPTGILTDDPSIITCANEEVMLTAEFQSDTLQYTWIAPDDTETMGTSAMAADSGYYVLVTEVIATHCITLDSILIDIDTIPPPAIASPGTDTTFIGCDDMATLEGFGGDDPGAVTVRWLNSLGVELTTSFNFPTNQVGEYVFEVTDTLTGCVNTDTTLVVANDDLPVVTIVNDPVPAFDCNGDPVELTAEVTNADPNAVTILWTGPAVDPGDETILTPTVNAPGDYQVVVESNANGCIATAMITVDYDTIPPVVSFMDVDTLNCINESVTITSSVTPVDGEYRYEWLHVPTNEDQFDNLASQTVGLEGMYRVIVTDTISGCSTTEFIDVQLDTSIAEFTFGFIPTLNCVNDTAAVVTSVDLPDGTYSINWEPQSGQAMAPEIVNDSVALFMEPGEYLLMVTNLVNGCTAQDSINREVQGFFDEVSITLAGDSYEVNCLNPSVLLDATGSSEGDTIQAVTYQWNVLEGSADGPFNDLTLNVEQGGMYEFVVVNEASLCEARDTVTVTADFEEPIAVSGNNLNLACDNTMGDLDGTGSSEGAEFFYIWEEIDPDMATVIDTFASGFDAMITPAIQEGAFRLVVYNTLNGCESVGEVVTVDYDGELPVIVFGIPDDPQIGTYDVNCISPDTLQVNFFVSNDTLFDLDDLIPSWDGGTVIQEEEIFVAYIPLDQIDTDQIFTITIVDDASGCTGVNDFFITDTIDYPVAALVEETSLIGCDGQGTELDGSPSTQGDDISYSWQDATGMEVGVGLTYTPTDLEDYYFIVTNESNFCMDTITAMTEANEIAPPIMLDSVPSITCDDTMVPLSAAMTGDPSEYIATWSAGIIDNGDLTAVANAPGEYTLTITSVTTQCDTMITFTVPDDSNPPELGLNVPADLACPGSTVQIVTSINDGVQSVTWDGPATVSPPNGLTVSVTEPGTYTLTVIGDNGCTATGEATVVLDPSGAPISELTASDPDLELSCDDAITLAFGGTPDTAYTYEYLTVEGSGVAVPAMDSLSAEVTMAGGYALVVTNVLNGCSDTSEVLTITMIELAEASAQIDSAGCGDLAIVSGNLPPNATGQWSGPTGVLFESPTEAATVVTGLFGGENNIVWTLSYDGCPDYAADSVMITPELAPVAILDTLIIAEGQVANTINVVTNDQFNGVTDYNITFGTNTILGTLLDEGEGDITYTLLASQLIPGADEFTYEICNTLCPELCDEGLVLVEILRDTTGGIDTPSGITPNDDGMNDAFVIDELFLDPEKYKDNEMIIFNRWGDIVYEAQPYNNDWRGTNMEGEDLPGGTYYFILRLNIGDGEIIKGDVTIIR